MSIHHGTLLCLGILLMTSGGIMIFSSGTAYHATVPLMVLGIFLGMGGLSVMVAGVCMAKKNLQVGVPGHFLLHPPTGTRFSPQQALAIQRLKQEVLTESLACSHQEAGPNSPGNVDERRQHFAGARTVPAVHPAALDHGAAAVVRHGDEEPAHKPGGEPGARRTAGLRARRSATS